MLDQKLISKLVNIGLSYDVASQIVQDRLLDHGICVSDLPHDLYDTSKLSIDQDYASDGYPTQVRYTGHVGIKTPAKTVFLPVDDDGVFIRV